MGCALGEVTGEGFGEAAGLAAGEAFGEPRGLLNGVGRPGREGERVTSLRDSRDTQLLLLQQGFVSISWRTDVASVCGGTIVALMLELT